MTDDLHLDRRGFLRAAAAVGGTAMAGAGWMGTAWAGSRPAGDDADRLFRAGWFDGADRAYARQLRADPDNAHALGRRGYIALLTNRFSRAERFLGPLAAADPVARRRLAETFVRQDRHESAVPLLRATGAERDAAYAEQFAHLGAKPWQVVGARRTRVPFLGLEPLPHVEASLNGGPGRRFIVDTYGTLSLSAAVADELGLRAVASTDGVASSQPVKLYLGVLSSLRLGEIELRNIPVQWIDLPMPPLPDGGQPAGVIGTTVLYHLLSTMDYAGGALVLRRKGDPAPRTGNDLPLWLAGDHYPLTLGSLRNYGPRIVTLDTGGVGNGLETTVDTAERAGIPVDYAHPTEHNGATVYPITPDRISLGRAVNHRVRGRAVTAVWPGLPGPGQSAMFGFDVMANFTHEYFKPFAVTFDYTTMRVSVTRTAPS